MSAFDLNTVTKTGFYKGTNLGNAPSPLRGRDYVEVNAYVSAYANTAEGTALDRLGPYVGIVRREKETDAEFLERFALFAGGAGTVDSI